VSRRRAGASRRSVLVLAGSILALLIGGLVVVASMVDSPAARLQRRAIAAHRRAQRMAVPGVAGSYHPTVARGSPTVAGQVATVSIPALGLTGAPVLAEGVVHGYLRIPAEVRDVGWDDQTPSPGRPGVTLLAGHVNWVGQGEGALGLIGQLVPGDRVLLDWEGRSSTWVVRNRPTLSPNTVVHPALFSDRGLPRLALVTCGGPFRETAAGGSYADNVIVVAVPAPTPRR
jgi:sortase (surface protein transpeptidase)